MARLIDRLMYDSGIISLFRERLQNVVDNDCVVVIDNVTRFMLEGDPQAEWNFITDFPNLTPIGSQVFFESKAPPMMMLADRTMVPWRDANGPLKSWGFLVESADVNDLKQFPDELVRMKFSSKVLSMLNPEQRAQVRWVSAFHLFVELDNELEGILCTWALFIKEDGTLVTGITSDGQTSIPMYMLPHFILNAWRAEGIQPTEEMLAKAAQAGRELRGTLYPILLAISCMHSSKTKVELVEPPVKLSKAHLKRHKRSLTPFLKVDVTELQQELETRGESATKGLRHAIQTCGDLFRNGSVAHNGFRQLVGIVEGAFWWVSRLKGDGFSGPRQSPLDKAVENAQHSGLVGLDGNPLGGEKKLVLVNANGVAIGSKILK